MTLSDQDRLQNTIEKLGRLEELISADQPGDAAALMSEILDSGTRTTEKFTLRPEWAHEVFKSLMHGGVAGWTVAHTALRVAAENPTKKSSKKLLKAVSQDDPERLRLMALRSVQVQRAALAALSR
jgi:hypothetical protein